MSKPTMSGRGEKKHGPGSRRYIHRLTVNLSISQPQALSTCIHYGACTTNPMCHCTTGCLGPRHPAFSGTPPEPTREIPPSSVSLAGHHQNSNWGREPAFNPPVQSSHGSQMLATLDRQQRTLAQSSEFCTAAARVCQQCCENHHPRPGTEIR